MSDASHATDADETSITNRKAPFLLFLAMAILAAPSVAQDEAQPTDEEQVERSDEAPQIAARSVRDGERLGVDQIVLPTSNDAPNGFQIESTEPSNEGQAQVGQLPGDLEVPDDDGTGPEQAISRPIQSPEAKLFGRVAEAWQLIRERGQQPTPELIAREIGPDQLATFLDQNPAATDIFGQDSDTLPVDEVPGLEQLPDGGIFLIPPQGG